jgi:CheY-like chemotaxis protein
MPSNSEDFPPARLRVFIVEDEFHVLLLLEDMLADLDCQIVATASILTSALEMGQTCDADTAILDINLAGQKVYPVAACLRGRGIRIIFSPGYGLTGLDQSWRSYPVLENPYLPRQLAAALYTREAARDCD